MKSKIININKRYLPPDRLIPLMTVLVAGEIGDYAAYQAITEDPEYAQRFGDKISFKEASCHFPGGLEEELYRE